MAHARPARKRQFGEPRAAPGPLLAHGYDGRVSDHERGNRASALHEATRRDGAVRSSAVAPLVRGAVVAAFGSAVLILTGGVLGSNGGLLFIGGLAGAVTGLLIARAVVPERGAPAMSRSTAIRAAVAIALAAVVVGAIGIWIVGRAQGGVLGPIEYFLETSGVLLPAVAIVSAVAAAWGASAGPVQR